MKKAASKQLMKIQQLMQKLLEFSELFSVTPTIWQLLKQEQTISVKRQTVTPIDSAGFFSETFFANIFNCKPIKVDEAEINDFVINEPFICISSHVPVAVYMYLVQQEAVSYCVNIDGQDFQFVPAASYDKLTLAFSRITDALKEFHVN